MSLVSLMNSMMFNWLPNPILTCLKACTYRRLRSIFLSKQSTAGKRFPGNLNLRRRDPWIRNDLIEGDS